MVRESSSTGVIIMLALEPSPDFAQRAEFPLCAAKCALLAEVNHRTANQFMLLSSYIHLCLEEFRRHPGEIRDLQLAFAAVESRALALAGLNHQLTSKPTGELVDVSLILHQVCATFGDNGNAFHNVVDEVTGSHLVTNAVSIAVGQMATEAVMNSLKYAYPKDEEGDVIVRSTPWAPGELLIEVIDRGVGGFPASLSPTAKSFGVRLMRGLASQEKIGLKFIATSPGISVQFLLALADQTHSESSLWVRSEETTTRFSS